MRKIIIKICIFAAIIAAFDIAFGLVMEHIKTHAKGGVTKSQYAGFRLVDSEALLFGSSRCVHHYDPSIITDSLGMSCYNLGQDGLGIIYHYAKFSSIIERYTPKVVVYDIISTFDLLDEGNYDKYIKAFRPYYGYGETAEIASSIDRTEKWKNLSALYRYNKAFIQIASDYIHPLHEVEGNGFMPTDLDMRIEFEVKQDEPLNKPDPIKMAYLQRMIDVCRDNDIKLVFALSPAYRKTHSDAYAAAVDLCRRNNVPLLNHYCDEDFVNSKEYFYDGLHMNTRGARAFTSKFAHELKELLD